ncbi:hypothetical protein BDF21DRAFT_491489 [Thamnidium elegans]|uniref:Membrane anchor Opy2 N-terminal domain-containing protein n=1 Tax=Thamnidium elegans TaxID=101142 RepID=A0A8H7SJB6_9FUNG|nr:hypothetical protein INT48_005482 [Thamnidium elegans]KAI8088477.1 hypothetical protein BDF21DRAFT_491489 [Thamnidium elegans]
MRLKSCQLSFLSIVGLLITSSLAQNCTPSNCSASCSPGCSIDNVCTLGTMLTCGVCPGSKCISRATLGLPPLPSPEANTKPGSGPLIGGIVGGIFGGGLLLCGVGYLIYRQRKKKNTLPLAFRSPDKLHRLERTTPMDQEIEDNNNNNTRQIMSGVIPVTFIPPSRPESTATIPESETPQARYGSFSTFANQHEDDPFSDRPISNAHSIMTTTTNNGSRRGSMESTISHQQTATVVQATQMMRAKPQIMRVNTVKPTNGLARSGSIKTIKPVETTTDNPFDDKNKIPERKVTDSVMSAPGDGEITIFWNGS